jgi:hypothetical protein
LKLERKIRGNPVLLLEQNSEVEKESRGRHMVASLSAWSQAQLLGQFSRDWFSEHLANSVFLKCFIYFFVIFILSLIIPIRNCTN